MSSASYEHTCFTADRSCMVTKFVLCSTAAVSDFTLFIADSSGGNNICMEYKFSLAFIHCLASFFLVVL